MRLNSCIHLLSIKYTYNSHMIAPVQLSEKEMMIWDGILTSVPGLTLGDANMACVLLWHSA